MIYTHRKSIIEPDELPKPRECLFRMVDQFATPNQPIHSIVSILAGKIMSQQNLKSGQIPVENYYQSDQILSQQKNWKNSEQMDLKTEKILRNQDWQSGETQQDLKNGEISSQQDFICLYSEKNYIPIVCSLEEMGNFVERFLCIKDMEEELTKLGWTYFVEFGDDKAIFWCQQPNILQTKLVVKRSWFLFFLEIRFKLEKLREF